VQHAENLDRTIPAAVGDDMPGTVHHSQGARCALTAEAEMVACGGAVGPEGPAPKPSRTPAGRGAAGPRGLPRETRRPSPIPRPAIVCGFKRGA
jgi:hypothetical protein